MYPLDITVANFGLENDAMKTFTGKAKVRFNSNHPSCRYARPFSKCGSFCPQSGAANQAAGFKLFS